MGTITERKLSDGSKRFLAQVGIKQKGKWLHRENRTFEHRRDAKLWAGEREAELAKPGALERILAVDPPLSFVIDEYLAATRKEPGRTKKQVLRSIKTYPLAALKCSEINSQAICRFIDALSVGRHPQTVENYLMHLSGIFRLARPKWGYPLDPQALKDARTVARDLEQTGKSKARERRPTVAEIDKLMSHFAGVETRRPGSLPMTRIIPFAMFSTRRQEEITTIHWPDLEREPLARILVRDMKHPGQKVGNNVWCDLTPEALRIIESMPRTDARIFPYSTDAICAAFTRACKFLGIVDLHFHDLRHEGVSRLFEMGWTIPHVAAVSGHRSWNSLKRYTQLQQRGDKWKGWKGLDVICGPARKTGKLKAVA
jgi:integrase